MSMLNNSGEESAECPLCMELLEMDDLSFYPCTCGYQICRFCWHRIRTDENGLCPACRKAYPENPADFKPLSTEEMHRIKAEKRHKDQLKKQKATENRKHLSNVRVVQRNLVFVVGLSPRLADPEVLKRHEYFGKFGKIHKVVINHSTQYAGSQGPSASAYVTYVRGEDALRAIQSVNNIFVDGRTLRASLGTTKYCSHFMKNQPCPKPDCMYLHEIGDDAASFTKEEMQQGKHTEYERTLHEQLFLYQNHKEGRKTSTSPPLQGATTGPQSGTRDAWPSLPPGNPTSNSTSLTTNSGKGGTAGTKNEVNTKEKNSKNKGKTSQALPNNTNSNQSEESTSKPNGQSRKVKEKQPATTTVSVTQQQQQIQQPKQPRQRSTSRSPALSSSSNPTPPPISSSPPSAPEGGFPSTLQQTQQQILQQGASLAAEEEEIDRARDEAAEAEDYGDKNQTLPSYSHTHPILDSGSNNHSFFSTGPLPAYTARSTGPSPSGCWLANGAEEGHMTSSLPKRSASDWQSAYTEVPSAHVGTSVETVNHVTKSSDDDLGFDPFHETQKALAEMLEKESISNGTSSCYSNTSAHHMGYSGHMQSLYSNHTVQPTVTRQSPNLGLGLGLGLGVGISAQQTQTLRTRIPPPGFNPSQMGGSLSQGGSEFGLSLPNLSSARPTNHMEMGASKMLPFMNNHTSNTSASTGLIPGPRLYTEAPSIGLGIGVGMGAGSGINNLGYLPGQNGSINPIALNKTQSYGMGIGSSLSYNGATNSSNSLGLGSGVMADPAPCVKDWQDGFRALFPNINISMNNGGVNNSNSNSRMGAFPPGLSGLGNGQNQLQSSSAQTKGWRNSVPDWTALDPAIVSSGQITDSRSDSPPHWLLRSLEQLTESSPAQPSSNPSNLFGMTSSSHYNMPSLSARNSGNMGLDGSNTMGSFWPTTHSTHTTSAMPPPGFSHLRPPTKAAAAGDMQKIDNL